MNGKNLYLDTAHALTPGELSRVKQGAINAERARTVDLRIAAAVAKGKAAAAKVNGTTAAEQLAYASTLVEWAHKNEGTPQTHARAAKLRQSAISRMVKLGKLSVDDFANAVEIAEVVEMLESGVAMRTATLERVDCSGSGRDALVEGLRRVRAEVAYTLWRDAIPTPKRMILDMICAQNVTYVALAASYGMHWRTARKRLVRALRAWPAAKDAARQSVSRDDLNEIHAQLES